MSFQSGNMLSLTIILLIFGSLSGCLGLSSQTKNILSVSALCDGSVSISLHNHPWLFSESVFLRSHSRRYSSHDRTLKVVNCNENLAGYDDILGSFTSTEIIWEAEDDAAPFITVVKTYLQYNMVSFHQKWPLGAQETSSNDKFCDHKSKDMSWIGCDWPGVASSFPSFVVAGEKHHEEDDDDDESPHREKLNQKAWMEFYGQHLNDAHNEHHRGPRIGLWEKGAAIKGGLLAGPIAVFDRSGSVGIVSSFSHHMSASMAFENDVLQYGVMGGVNSIPPGFEISFVLVAGISGLNRAFTNWGEILLAVGRKEQRGFVFDPTCTHLGYQTDNGAYYYYHPSIGGNYLETLTAVVQGINKKGSIPYRFVELDSWRYFKGRGTTGGAGVPIGGGLKNWTTDPSTFPNGDQGVMELKTRTNILGFLAHNRWFQNVTDYAKENGGRWDFILETNSDAFPGNAFSLPTDEKFWKYLMVEAKKSWGLIVYEQDWLWTQFLGMEATTRNVLVADTWLQQMNAGAQKAGLSIQYCMSLPRHVMASTSLPAVTQVRVSDDYGAGARDQQWRIGRSSMLAASLGLAAYKDGWMSTQHQTAGAFNGSEPNPPLQSAVSAFSTGPVTPGDGVGQENRDLIMKTCTLSGKLLHPSRSAVAVDSSYIDEAFYGIGSNSWPNRTEIWATYTTFDDYHAPYIHVLAADLQQQSINLPLDEADTTRNELTKTSAFWVVYRSWPEAESPSFAVGTMMDIVFPLQLRVLPDFEVWHGVPVDVERGDGWCLLGERHKWIPVSTTRIAHIVRTDKGMEVNIKGDVGEIVTLRFLHVDVKTMMPIEEVEVTCDFTANNNDNNNQIDSRDNNNNNNNNDVAAASKMARITVPEKTCVQQ